MKHLTLAAIILSRLPFLFGTIVDQAIADADIFYEPPLRLGLPETKMENVQNLTSSEDIKVIVHGYVASRTHFSISSAKNAYLSQGIDNVFMAEWHRAAAYSYQVSRYLITRVGQRLARIIEDFLTKHDLDTSKVHLIGHSLGAHVVGVIGRYFNGTIGRVTGLDPALPLFTPDSKDSLRKSDGVFVDVIHTDAGVLGDVTPRGDADFYPNYGSPNQPGCTSEDWRSLTMCSHIRAVQLYAESIVAPKNFPAVPCPVQDIQSKDTESCQPTAVNVIAFMGDQVEKSARGQYYLETSSAPPYGMGLQSKIVGSD